jgi:hypothetical protein
MRASRVFTAAVIGLIGLRPGLDAQDSPFAIRGLGIPGRVESVRARATGGAFAPFDPLSELTEASVADVRTLTATAAGATSYLTDEIAGQKDSRRTARFPLFQVFGPLWHGVVVGGGFSTYLDRSYRVVIPDTLQLGGSSQAITDELSSDGGVSDLRFVAARRFGPLALGAGFHLLAGSSRLRALRSFSDTSPYQGALQTEEATYSGVGASASAMLRLHRGLSLAAYYRSDYRLDAKVRNQVVVRTDLPTTVGAALAWLPSPDVRLAVAYSRSSWGSAADSGAFDTKTWSAGAELGSPRLPIRFGVRSGQLPFGPGQTAPREVAVAVGSGITLARGLGVIDFALERLRRTGSGLTENGWTFLVGLTLRPTALQ